MRHRKSKKKLPGPTSYAQAMLRNLAISLITHGRIETTVKRAKVLRPFVERVITRSRECAWAADYASRDHSYRLVRSALGSDKAAAIATRVWGPRFQQRPGGYTRIMRNGFRVGDCAELAIIEFVDWAELGRTSDDVASLLEQRLPTGIKYVEKWRSVPSPTTTLRVDESRLEHGRVNFEMSIVLEEQSLQHSDWPRFARQRLPMELTLSLAIPKAAVVSKFVALDGAGEPASESVKRIQIRLDGSKREARVRGEVSLGEIPEEGRYCLVSVDGPAGEIFHATIL